MGKLHAHALRRFDRECIALVSEACVRTRADIILSTAWRGETEEDRAVLEDALWTCGLDRSVQVLGQTPHLASLEIEWPDGRTTWELRLRGEEIVAWLDKHRPGWTRDRIVAVDDESFHEPVEDRLVQTTFELGFEARHRDRVLELLGEG